MRIDEFCLLKKHKFSMKNLNFNRAPDQATINEVTGCVESGVDKSFNFNRSFVRQAIGVRNTKYFLFFK